MNAYRNTDWFAVMRADFPKFGLNAALVEDVAVPATVGAKSYNDFDPMGGMWHYTAGSAGRSGAQSEALCRALLKTIDYNMMVARSGKLLIGRTKGQVWHAGVGNTAQAQKARSGQITRHDLTTWPQNTSSGGNRMLCSLCCDTSGSEPITGAVRRVMHVATAIICWKCGWQNTGRVDGHWLHHRSYTNRKYDLCDHYPDRNHWQGFDEGWLADHQATLEEAKHVYFGTPKPPVVVPPPVVQPPKPPVVPPVTRPPVGPAVWAAHIEGAVVSVDATGQVVDRAGRDWVDLWDQTWAGGKPVGSVLAAPIVHGEVIDPKRIVLYAGDATTGGGVFDIRRP